MPSVRSTLPHLVSVAETEARTMPNSTPAASSICGREGRQLWQPYCNYCTHMLARQPTRCSACPRGATLSLAKPLVPAKAAASKFVPPAPSPHLQQRRLGSRAAHAVREELARCGAPPPHHHRSRALRCRRPRRRRSAAAYACCGSPAGSRSAGRGRHCRRREVAARLR